MKLLIHDLEAGKLEELLTNIAEDVIIVCDDKTIKNCIGCFGCWIKTPGKCIIRDNYGDMGEMLSKCDELIIISRCFYGGYSPFVKNVLDRSISYVHPDFEIRNGEMHHKRRYENKLGLNITFYGDDITDKEKETAENLVKANAVNLMCYINNITFLHDVSEIKTIEVEECKCENSSN